MKEFIKKLLSENGEISSTRFVFLFQRILFSLVLSFAFTYFVINFNPDALALSTGTLGVIAAALGVDAVLKYKQKSIENTKEVIKEEEKI